MGHNTDETPQIFFEHLSAKKHTSHRDVRKKRQKGVALFGFYLYCHALPSELLSIFNLCPPDHFHLFMTARQ
jgi:hypothetical protein